MRHRDKDGRLIDPVSGYPAWDLDSSTHKAQCRTSHIHRELHGKRGNVSSVDAALNDPYYLFRALPAYRTKDARKMRRAVYREVMKRRAA